MTKLPFVAKKPKLDLPPQVRARVATALPLGMIAAANAPGIDAQAFSRLEKQDRERAACLSAMIIDALAAQRADAVDPRLVRRGEGHLLRTLRGMADELSSVGNHGKRSFVQSVLALAADHVGRDDRRILTALSDHAGAERLGFTAAQTLRLPAGEDDDLQTCAQWAACQCIDAPFACEGAATGTTPPLGADRGAWSWLTGLAGYFLPRGTVAWMQGALAEWQVRSSIGGFRSAAGLVPHGAVIQDPSVEGSLAGELARRPLARGEAMVVWVRPVQADGTAHEAHAIAITGAPAPRLVDASADTVYDFTGPDVGTATQEYLEQRWQAPGGTLNCTMIRLRRGASPRT